MIEKYYSDISVKKLFNDENLISIHKGIENYVSNILISTLILKTLW